MTHFVSDALVLIFQKASVGWTRSRNRSFSGGQEWLEDLEAWETALVVEVKKAGDDPGLLLEMASIAEVRVRDRERREQASEYLRRRGTNDRHRALARRLASN